MNGAPLDGLAAFRSAVYAAFGRRRDALFELLDALLTAGPVPSAVHLSLAPLHRRGWGSLYAALARGTVAAERLERLLAAQGLPEEDGGGPPVYAVDTSVWPRCDAETSPARGFYHHPTRHSNGQPIVAGWAYQWVAQVRRPVDRWDSWTAPRRVRRVPPGASVTAVAAAQVRQVVAGRAADGRLPLFVFDAGYGTAGLAEHLGVARGETPAAVLVRLRAGRCFSGDPPPYPGAATGRGGRPRRHGRRFACAEPETWGAPDAEHTEEDARYGRGRVRAWAGLRAKVQRYPGRGAGGPTPIDRGTVLLLQVSRLPRPTRAPEDVWLWWQGPSGAAPDLATAWRAYVARFALEHTLRFCKQTLRWASPRVRHPEQADRWTWLVVLAHVQLQLAHGAVADRRLPWERPRRPEQLTPYRVWRESSQLCARLGTPAAPPKPAGRPAGRPKGRRHRPATRHPAVKLGREEGARILLRAA